MRLCTFAFVLTIRNTFLFLAFGFLMLHSIVPHHHFQEEAETGCELASSETGIVELLSLIFHEDLGKQHLEDFDAQNQSLDLIALLPQNALQIVTTPTKSAPVFIRSGSAKHFHQTASGRGPPHLITV